MKILLAGQDITAYVEEPTIDIKQVLGQGPGTMGGASGTSSTCTFRTSLGPVATAVGAGSAISSPQLVRGAEVLVYDQNMVLVYGGYGMLLKDVTERTRVYTEIDCYDYWQHMDRIMVNRIYDGSTDIYMIRDLLNTYAPWINQTALPTLAQYTFGPCIYRHISLQKALQKICDTVGNAIWVAPNKQLQYLPFNKANTHSFSLSTAPNFSSTYDMEVTRYEQDDTAVINRVTFFGGKVPTADYTQNLSNQATGSNDTLILAYYPRIAGDGAVHVNINGGPDLVLGFDLGTNVAHKNILKKNGGLCDVLLNSSAHTLVFNVDPPAGGLVTCRYRHEQSLTTVITDPVSYRFYGQWYDGFISDQTVFTTQDAVQRCQILLNQQSNGFLTIELITHKSGILIGNLLGLYHSIRGINQTLMVQELDVLPQGAGQFKYKITLGAWSIHLSDVLVNQAHLHAELSMVVDRVGLSGEDSTDTLDASIDVTNVTESAHVTDVASIVLWGSGPFYSRATPSGDGHDAYPGFSTI